MYPQPVLIMAVEIKRVVRLLVISLKNNKVYQPAFVLGWYGHHLNNLQFYSLVLKINKKTKPLLERKEKTA